jgi:photosystem II stability/assembly factor-like uncharacterized protein
LPDSASLLMGDEVKVLVRGSGAVSVMPNAGQTFLSFGDLATPSSWTLRNPGVGASALTMSSDATREWTGVYQGGIYGSTDYGRTWTLSSAPSTSSTYWLALASSPDGVHLAAGELNGFYTSHDSGQTWLHQPNAPVTAAAAISADGQTILIGAGNGGQPWISTNGGVDWTQSPISTIGTPNWISAYMSQDATRMALADNNGFLWVSSDSGTSWTQGPLPASGRWNWLAGSSDGRWLFATSTTAGIYVSSDHGATWTASSAPAVD